MTDVVRCVLCPAEGPGADWTARPLAEVVILRNSFSHDAGVVLPADYQACAACSAWLDDPDRDEQALPAHLLEPVELLVKAATLDAITARQLRADLVGQVRHLAEALTPWGGDP